MQTCAKCGTDNKEGVLFCGGCGAKFVPKKKIPVAYIVGAVVLLIVGAIAFHFMFDGQNSQPQTAVISAPNISPATGVARNTPPPSPRPVAKASPSCDAIQLSDYTNEVSFGYMQTCISFFLNSGQKSLWIAVPPGFSFSIGDNAHQPFKAFFDNGATYEVGTNQKVDMSGGSGVFELQAEVDNTQFSVTIHRSN